MAARTTRRTRRRKPQVEEVEVEEVEVDDVEEEEEEAPAPPKRKRRTRRSKAKVEEPVVEEEEEEAPAPPKRKRRSKAKVEEPVVEEEDVAEDVGDSFEDIAVDDAFGTLAALLEEGKSMLVTRRTADSWLIQLTDVAVSTPSTAPSKKKGGYTKAYWAEVHSDDYIDFLEEWKDLTHADKAKKCTKCKVHWEEHDDPRVNAMRMNMAYREKMGIAKYGDEYQDRASRDAVRGI